MFGRTGVTQKGVPTGQRMSDGNATFSGLWGHLYGVLRHLKVHLVQHDILWPGGSVCRIAKSEISELRKPHLKQVIAANLRTDVTLNSCKFLYINVQITKNLREGPTF